MGENIFLILIIWATSICKSTYGYIHFVDGLLKKVIASSIENFARISSALEAKSSAMFSAVKTKSLFSALISSSFNSFSSLLRLKSGESLLLSLLLFLLFLLIKQSNSYDKKNLRDFEGSSYLHDFTDSCSHQSPFRACS